MNACKVGSIRQIHQRLLDAGYNVSEYTLRIWVKNGSIHAVLSPSRQNRQEKG